MKVRFTLNGSAREVQAHEAETLLDLLRGPCAVTSPKRGCQPAGQCGACLAIVDGEPRSTCSIPAASAEGTSVLTLEGLPPAERETFARAFTSAHALQCGFCTPGIVLRAHHLLATNHAPTRDQIVRALDEHLCRCTGYLKVVEAIELVARIRRGEPAPGPVTDGGVGASL